jgi:hypothetical protein
VKTSRNNNSILVLATLGVYLGLVLVGGTPQVLAQAAMTRQFNVREEIEFKEDLDDKPQGTALDERSSASDKLISAAVGTFLADLTVIHPAETVGAPSLAAVRFTESGLNSSPDTFQTGSARLLSLVTTSNLARAGL